MTDLTFRTPQLSDQSTLTPYFRKYGENSCQHSFVSMYTMGHKYGDRFCIRDGCLYVLRQGLCKEGKRVYLFPFCEEDAVPQALERIIEDAHAQGCRAAFFTITERQKRLMEKVLPETFTFEENRDYAEYLYYAETLAHFPGRHLASKRANLRKFMANYGEELVIKSFSPEEDRPEVIQDILAFQEKWLRTKETTDNYADLITENAVILKTLEERKELGIRGIALYVAGKLAGYAYGTELSDSCIDELAEKGDARYDYVYQAVNHAFAEYILQNYKYINKEEDVGLRGLRKSKLSYRPDRLLVKYAAWEG